jgi:hypothetical protein
MTHLAYLCFGVALTLTVIAVALGLARHQPAFIANDAIADTCCWAPKHGRDTRCYPCRPSSPANR